MTINDVFKDSNEPIQKKDLIPFKDIEKDDIKKNMKMCAEVLDKDINRFYYKNTGFFPGIYYYYNYILLEVYPLKKLLIEMNYKENLNKLENRFKELIEKKNFKKIFSDIIHPKAKILVYKELFDIIPDEDKFDIFCEVYTLSEYGFLYFDKAFMKKVFLYSPKNYIFELNHLQDEHGYITIYRGEGTKSASIKDAYSWSLNFNTALMFAAKHSETGTIYKGRISIDDIGACLCNNSYFNEDEILAFYEDIEDIEKIEVYQMHDIYNKLLESKTFDKYQEDITYIEDSLFYKPNGIHGVGHAKRVLFLANALSYLEKLNELDQQVLSFCAIYHDIGRNNDDYDEFHGIQSVEELDNMGLFEDNFKKEEQNIIKFIIKNHAIDDKRGFKEIDNYDITDKNRAIQLYKIFKDCDGLDRVRIRDLDPKYLRSEYSKKLVLVAEKLFQTVKK